MLEREPRAYQLHFGLGNLFYKRHDFLRAEDSYRKAIDLNPRLDRAYQNIAAIYCYHLHDNGKAS
jgi:tetratricopeptide (TPR) repeat protein